MLCVFFFPKGCVEDRIVLVFLIGLWDIANIWNSQISKAGIRLAGGWSIPEKLHSYQQKSLTGILRWMYEKNKQI